MGSHCVICYPTEVILTPLPWQCRAGIYCLYCRCNRYSFIDPERMKGWVDLRGWLYQDVYPQTVTRPIISRARRRVTRWSRPTRYH